VGADRAHAQRVAVGLGAGELADPEVAAGAGLVLDQESLVSATSSPWATRRANASVLPPAAKGTITITGLFG
jgi:hypothetical protein